MQLEGVSYEAHVRKRSFIFNEPYIFISFPQDWNLYYGIIELKCLEINSPMLGCPCRLQDRPQGKLESHSPLPAVWFRYCVVGLESAGMCFKRRRQQYD
jgi:hypothetical protein